MCVCNISQPVLLFSMWQASLVVSAVSFIRIINYSGIYKSGHLWRNLFLGLYLFWAVHNKTEAGNKGRERSMTFLK